MATTEVALAQRTVPLVKQPDPARMADSGYTPGAIRGVMFIRQMSDGGVLAAARDDSSKTYGHVLALLGPNTNRSWITSQCATEAYERGLIDEQEFDWFTQ